MTMLVLSVVTMLPAKVMAAEYPHKNSEVKHVKLRRYREQSKIERSFRWFIIPECRGNGRWWLPCDNRRCTVRRAVKSVVWERHAEFGTDQNNNSGQTRISIHVSPLSESAYKLLNRLLVPNGMPGGVEG